MENINLRKLLMRIGISSNMNGFHYILEAVDIIEKQKIHTNMAHIYKMISKKYNNTCSGAERAIRYALGKAYRENNILRKIYLTIPNNSVFLYDLVFNFDVFLNTIKE